MITPDKNYLSIADTADVGVREFNELVPPDGSFADTLKFSNAQNGTVRGHLLVGGAEDCLDCNRDCQNLDIHFDQWEARGKFVATIKGGSSDIRLSGRIVARGSETDIDLGNGSEQSNERTKRVVLNMDAEDGRPVRVRVLNAWRPVFENSPRNYCLNDTWKGVFVYVWLILHRFGLI